MSDYKMIDYGSVYEAILADNRQMRARIAELEQQLAEARKWMPSTSYSTGVLTIGERLYVEIRDWGGADEDAAWNHLQDEAGATE